jgi:Protein of unknown function (DUF3768)
VDPLNRGRGGSGFVTIHSRRSGVKKGGKLTSGVDSLPSDVRAMVIRKVATFVAFTGDDDPYGEHDFCNFEVAGQKFFFKIDLYEEADVKSANGEPVVTRVLTIMLAEEY